MAEHACYGFGYQQHAHSLRESLKLLPLTDIVLGEDDIDIAWSKWCDIFLSAVDTFPRKQTSRSYTPHYFTNEIVHLLHQKETTRRRAKKSDSVELWEKFRRLCWSVKSLIKIKKSEYLAETLPTNPKEFWKFFKSKSSKSSLPDTMTLADSSFTTSTAKADALNQFFASLFLPRPNTPRIPTTELNSSTEFIPVSIEEVCYLRCL